MVFNERKAELHLRISEKHVEWLNHNHPKKVGEVVEALIEEHINKSKKNEKKLLVENGINPKLRRQNGFVEYETGKWCEEKDYWKIESILRDIRSPRMPSSKSGE